MTLIFLFVGGAIAALFSLTILFGAPFLPTRRAKLKQAIDMLELIPGQLLVDLGSGDGRILREAARRGIRGIGYELNPLLVLYSNMICFRYRKLVQIRRQNYWQIKLPECDAIYLFLANPFMRRMEEKLQREVRRTTKVLSFVFLFPGQKPTKQSAGLNLYIYPET